MFPISTDYPAFLQELLQKFGLVFQAEIDSEDDTTCWNTFWNTFWNTWNTKDLPLGTLNDLPDDETEDSSDEDEDYKDYLEKDHKLRSIDDQKETKKKIKNSVNYLFQTMIYIILT